MRLFFLFFLFFLVLFSSSFVFGSFIFLQNPNNETLDDSWVNDSSPDANYGASTFMIFGDEGVTPDNRSAFIKFNLSSVPSNVLVDYADLRFHDDSGHGAGYYCYAYRVFNSSWDESVITYNNNPCGAGFLNAFCSQSYDGFGISEGTGFEMHINVTDLLNVVVLESNSSVSFRVACDSGVWGGVYSKEYYNIPSRRPFLNITYSDRLTPSIVFPVNGSFLSYNSSIDLNFSVVNSSALDSCVYSIDGWVSNYSIVGCSNTEFNISEGNDEVLFLWINDSNGNEAIDFVNFSVDLTDPLVDNVSVSTNAGSSIGVYSFDVFDVNIDSCWYNTNINVSNISFSCSGSGSIDFGDFGDYTIFVYANDSAGNVGNSSASFSLIQSAGGGGGGGSVIIIQSAANFSVLTNTGSRGYSVYMIPGQSRFLPIIVSNIGSGIMSLNFFCEGDCDYLSVNVSSPIVLDPGEELLIPAYFVVPESSLWGDRFVYIVNFESDDWVEGSAFLRSSVTVSRFGEFSLFFQKLNPFVSEGQFRVGSFGSVPKLLFYVVVGLLLFFGVFVLFSSPRDGGLAYLFASLVFLAFLFFSVLFDSLLFDVGWF